MLTSLISRVVRLSVRHAPLVIAAALLLGVVSAVYTARHFAINTDISGLIDTNAAWAKRGKAIDTAFPHRDESTLVVVSAPAPELAREAADQLAARLRQDTASFRSVERPGGGAFFETNGLLYLDVAEVERVTQQLTDAKPLLNRLARDPTVTGLSSLLSLMLSTPLANGDVKLENMAGLFDASATAVDAVLAHRSGALSWQALLAPDAERRSFIEVRPVVDYGALEAGQAAAERIRGAAQSLQLAQHFGAHIALTGSRPLADEEFASVAEGAIPNAVATLMLVLIIVWLAVRSGRLMLAVFVTLLVGLSMTAAAGLLLVGALNLISVAFAVLFVGIGIDFGIQFAVRYREARLGAPDVEGALRGAARSIAMPLALAAAATGASFFSFLPTAYRGISELGEIAGVGILFIAFPLSVTLLPALIAVLKPPAQQHAPGFRSLAPVDRFTARHRKPLLYGTLALVVAGLPLLAHLRFDFNPLHLKDPHSESMSTLLTLAQSPNNGVNDVAVLAPDLAHADALATRIKALPEVGRTMTASSFVPADQAVKLAAIQRAAAALAPVLSQTPINQAGDGARISALRYAAGMLDNAALDHPGKGAPEAQRLAAALRRLAGSDPATRDRAEDAIALPLRLSLRALADMLRATPITLDSLPPTLKRQWIAEDGRARVAISPRVMAGQDPNDDVMLRRFTEGVTAAVPEAAGGPISILHSADTIVAAFYEASAWALVAVTMLLWLALRRFTDVLRTLVPLLVSALVTLELCVLIDLPLNFANIIALPLLLGIGVAFKIYYVIAWREGRSDFLQSGLTQAVILSAATTATAFGSLWLSHHPGTASMGKLLSLSLFCTLIGAVFFQPILMGQPPAPRASPRPSELRHNRGRE
ncbi:hopanoid transporter HpnN [Chitinasiproducens palmae]|uniref:Membrane transport protein MMPL domain-containing protein n=1 Tax=Chitinasiproducens palmae TaxID=1770053 RepID=A0A1H2PU77_9BURK|nr:MMPL family transporter [Chitinasiproducens palmae]SDV49869.1 hypothetical protein SAMN05216551_109205 [Chitinasiproducens palmae]